MASVSNDSDDGSSEFYEDFSYVDDDRNTHLHYLCALNKDLDRIENALENGPFKIDEENHLGWTPLMMAARNGHVAIVQFLIDRKANTTKTNQYGINVFLMGVASGNLDVLAVILRHLLYGGVSRRHIERVISPISCAILFQQEAVCRYLLDQKFDPDAATLQTHLTPLMFAIAIHNDICNTTIRNLLMTHQVDVTIQNVIGLTVADIEQQMALMCTSSAKEQEVPTAGPVAVVTAPPPYLPPLLMPPPNFVYPISSPMLTPTTAGLCCCLTPNVTPTSPYLICGGNPAGGGGHFVFPLPLGAAPNF